MYSIWQEPWLLTEQGPISPEALLSAPHNHADLQHGFVHQDAALLRLLVLMQARGNAERLDLYGDRPFLQVPFLMTETLPRTPLHALHLTSATGRDVTLLTPTFDAAPREQPHAEAARILCAFQLFAPSRGLTAWNPSKDNPVARSVTFHAIGAHLGETLALNTAAGLGDEPAFWERQFQWQHWEKGTEEPLTLSTAHSFPWRSITLEPEGSGVRFVRQASGRIPSPPAGPWPDPHTLGKHIPENEQEKRGSAWDRLRNPQSREVYGSLVNALIAALEGDPLAPVSFRKAEQQGGTRAVRAIGLITRSGQPVVQNLAQAQLPWPKQKDAGLEALQLTAQGYQVATEQARTILKKAGQPSSFSAVQTSQLPSHYWQALWPSLSLNLAGQLSYTELEQATHEASQNSARNLTGQI